MLATFVIDIICFTRSLSDATVGYNAMFVVSWGGNDGFTTLLLLAIWPKIL